MRLTLPIAAIGAILSIAFGAGASLAVSKSQIANAEIRLDKIEADRDQRNVDMARMSQKLDDISDTIRRIERKLDR